MSINITTETKTHWQKKFTVKEEKIQKSTITIEDFNTQRSYFDRTEAEN